MSEEKEGVMRNAMTTRAPGGAKNVLFLAWKASPAMAIGQSGAWLRFIGNFPLKFLTADKLQIVLRNVCCLFSNYSQKLKFPDFFYCHSSKLNPGADNQTYKMK